MLTPRRAATLALLLEATGDPKPGNVDRGHDHRDASLQQFAATATAVGPALAPAAEGTPLGAAIEDAAAATAHHGGGNTHFGAVLLLAPLVAAAGARERVDGDGSEGGDDGEGSGLRAAAERAVAGTTSEDAARFFAAVDRVDLALPPIDAVDDAALAGLDARDPATRDRVRDRGVTLADVMARSAPVDGVAREWTEGFPRTFRAADRLEHHHDGDGVERAVADAFLDLLAEEPDSFVAKRHGDGVAEEVRERAASIRDDGGRRAAVTALDEELLERGVNPGTTADLVAGGLFVALRRDGGFEV